MQHIDQQSTHSDISAFASWDFFALAIVLVLVNWVLAVLWLSMPLAQVKPIERPLHVDAQALPIFKP